MGELFEFVGKFLCFTAIITVTWLAYVGFAMWIIEPVLNESW